jgi:hypothetical protein
VGVMRFIVGILWIVLRFSEHNRNLVRGLKRP